MWHIYLIQSGIFVSYRPILDETDKTSNSPMANDQDQELCDLLKKFHLNSLYDKLHSSGVTTEIIWDLEEDTIDEIGMNKVERQRYKKAKNQCQNVKSNIEEYEDGKSMPHSKLPGKNLLINSDMCILLFIPHILYLSNYLFYRSFIFTFILKF